MIQGNKDIIGGGAIKDSNGELVVDSCKVKDIWSEYYEKLLNEEFDWSRDNLEEVEPVSRPVEEIQCSEVRQVISKSKCDKEPGISGRSDGNVESSRGGGGAKSEGF